MPLYVYVCRTCGGQSERLRSFAERLEVSTCPECKSEATFALSLSTPSFVGSAASEPCSGPTPGGGCCGGGACSSK